MGAPARRAQDCALRQPNSCLQPRRGRDICGGSEISTTLQPRVFQAGGLSIFRPATTARILASPGHEAGPDSRATLTGGAKEAGASMVGPTFARTRQCIVSYLMQLG